MTRHSVSAINEYQRCNRAYWLKYIAEAQVEPAPSDALSRGSAFHTGVAKALLALHDNPRLTPADLAQVAVEAALGYTDATATTFGIEQGAELARYHIEHTLELGTRYFPATWHDAEAAVEVSVESVFDVQGTPVTLRGFIDAILIDRVTEEVVLVDWKVRSTPHAAASVALDKQLYVYASLARRAGIKIDRLEQVQIGASRPAEPRLKQWSDPTRFASYHATLGKTTVAVVQRVIDSLVETDRADAAWKWRQSVVPDADFMSRVSLDLDKAASVTKLALLTARQIETDKLFLPRLHSDTCGWCAWRAHCTASL